MQKLKILGLVNFYYLFMKKMNTVESEFTYNARANGFMKHVDIFEFISSGFILREMKR